MRQNFKIFKLSLLVLKVYIIVVSKLFGCVKIIKKVIDILLALRNKVNFKQINFCLTFTMNVLLNH